MSEFDLERLRRLVAVVAANGKDVASPLIQREISEMVDDGQSCLVFVGNCAVMAAGYATRVKLFGEVKGPDEYFMLQVFGDTEAAEGSIDLMAARVFLSVLNDDQAAALSMAAPLCHDMRTGLDLAVTMFLLTVEVARRMSVKVAFANG